MEDRSRRSNATKATKATKDAGSFVAFALSGWKIRARWALFHDLAAPFYVLASTADVAWRYGQTRRHLQENGRLIGGNDLWIAATALAYRMPVVTRNAKHYRGVPGLDVETY